MMSTVLTVTDTNIKSNTASRQGGAIALKSNSTSEIFNSVITSNVAEESFGGGMYTSDSTSEISDSVFTSNQAQKGGGLYVSRSNVEINRSTVQGNKATEDEGGNGIRCGGTEANPSKITRDAANENGMDEITVNSDRPECTIQ